MHEHKAKREKPTPGKQLLLVLWTKRKEGIHMSHA